MHVFQRIFVAGAAALAIGACDAAERKTSGAEQPDVAAAAPDDTGRNAANRGGAEPTPMAQSNDPRDVETTRRIRDAITSQEGLSVYARNVKIITRAGSVVLLGPVEGEQEKQKLESIARSVAGAGNVDSQLEVTPGS